MIAETPLTVIEICEPANQSTAILTFGLTEQIARGHDNHDLLFVDVDC